MRRRGSSLDVTVTDQFCGAGGSSEGAEDAGAKVRLAMNHWKVACATYNTNRLEAISAHPGEWAPVRRYASPASASACASRLRCGRARAPAGVWEFEGRSNQEGGSDLYARLAEPPARTLGHAS